MRRNDGPADGCRLVNCAAMTSRGHWEDTSVELFDRTCGAAVSWPFFTAFCGSTTIYYVSVDLSLPTPGLLPLSFNALQGSGSRRVPLSSDWPCTAAPQPNVLALTQRLCVCSGTRSTSGCPQPSARALALCCHPVPVETPAAAGGWVQQNDRTLADGAGAPLPPY